MNTFASLLSLTLASAVLTCNAQDTQTQCAPTLDAMRVDFPDAALANRLHGVVRLGVRLDDQGNVTEARVIESSGHASLDRAALRSARKYWRFKVSDCTSTAQPIEHSIAVTYQRPPGVTVSGTMNRKALARTRELHADNRCAATPASNDTTVFACRDGSAAERGATQTIVAERPR